ncbi:hypothetical protein RKD18_006839 [Streptomyces phaeoluteigriseus]
MGGSRVRAGSEDLAEEVPCPFVPRVVEDLGGRALFDDPSGVDEDDPVGDLPGEADLVGDDDEGGTAGRQVPDDGEDLADEFGVEGGGGLVEEDDAGAEGEGARDGDALLLAAGELPGVGVGLVGEADAVEEFAGQFLGGRACRACRSPPGRRRRCRAR